MQPFLLSPVYTCSVGFFYSLLDNIADMFLVHASKKKPFMTENNNNYYYIIECM